MPNWAKWPLVCGCPHAAPRQLIADLWAKPGDTPKSPPEPNRAATVTDLAVEFARYAKRKYGDKPEWTSQIRNVLKDIREDLRASIGQRIPGSIQAERRRVSDRPRAVTASTNPDAGSGIA